MNCNTTQNEVGGKSLLLKVCKDATAATAATGSTITSVAHGLKVGDIAVFKEVGAIATLTANKFYYVKTVPSVDTFTVSETAESASIVPGALEATLDILTFANVGGLRSKSFGFASEGIDISSHDTDEYKKLADGAGMRSFSVSGSGVYTNEKRYQELETNAIQNKLMCLMFIDVISGKMYEGCFKITSIELSGDYDGEGSYSISAESSGTIRIETLTAS